MTHVLVFHHALGLTEGIDAFAGELRAAGHVVDTPDLFDGKTFTSLDDGVAHAESLGFENLLAAGTALASEHPAAVVYAGFSLGALIAHHLAQTRPGGLGALLYHYGDVPPTMFGDSWPSGVPAP